MGILEGRLKRKSQVLIKATSLEVCVSNESGNSLAFELFEWVVKRCPEELSRQPPRARFSCNVHGDIGAVEVFVVDPGDETLFRVHKADTRATTWMPVTSDAFRYPRADNVVMVSEQTFHSTLPSW